MKEISELESESGMTITSIDKKSFSIRGTVTYVSADTKGFHELASLMAPGADKFCRACVISRKI